MKIQGLVLAMMMGLTQVALAGAPAKTAELVSKGQAAYSANCMVCHGEKGDGNGPAGQALVPKPRNLQVKDEKVGGHYVLGGKAENLFKAISDGLPNTGMVGFAAGIPEQDRWGIVYYIQDTFQKGVKK